MKKLIPALSLLLISAMLLGTSTYAWFSMNNKVTVTGMEVRTHVSDNLFVAKTTLAATGVVSDANYKSFINDMDTTAKLLEPVSTVDGKAFFYTDSSTNVNANGSAKNTAFIAYAAGDAFDKTYGATDALGYVDYIMELKAVNGSESDKTVALTGLNLTYQGVETAQKAFRVAVFMQKFDGSAYTMINEASLGTAQIFAYDGSAYFEGKAVSGTEATAAVTTTTTGVTGTVTAGKTEYFKVVVRLWLEGQDTTCNNDTFASLTKNWAFDLTFELNSAPAATKLIGTPAIAATASGVTLDAAGKLTNGETPSTYAWFDAVTGVATGDTSATAPTGAGKYFCKVTTAKGNVYVTGVIVVE